MSDNSELLIGIMGAGIMGEALMVAISKREIASSSIIITDKQADLLTELKSKYGCSSSNANNVALEARGVS